MGLLGKEFLEFRYDWGPGSVSMAKRKERNPCFLYGNSECELDTALGRGQQDRRAYQAMVIKGIV
jgi:hypothetical protein